VSRLIAGTAILVLACTDTSDPPDTRSYRMGFSAIPPRLEVDLLVRNLDMWSTRADAAIMHVSVPWRGLIDGLSPDSSSPSMASASPSTSRRSSSPLP
jgi:hypothetical protein